MVCSTAVRIVTGWRRDGVGWQKPTRRRRSRGRGQLAVARDSGQAEQTSACKRTSAGDNRAKRRNGSDDDNRERDRDAFARLLGRGAPGLHGACIVL